MTRRAAAFVLAAAVILLTSFATRAAHAQSYIQQFPQGGQVLDDWKGADSTQMALRQWGALGQLSDILSLMSRGRAEYTPAERRLMQSYLAAKAMVHEPQFVDADARRKYHKQRTEYEFGATFREEVLSRYFTPQLITEYRQLLAAQNAGHAAVPPTQNMAKPRARGRAAAPQHDNNFILVLRFIGSMIRPALTSAMGLVGLALTIVFLLGSISGKAELDPANPIARLGLSTYELVSVTGTVRGKERNVVAYSHVSGGGTSPGGGVAPVTTSHTTVEHLSFFIRTPDGREVGIEEENVGFPVMDGHVASAVAVRKDGIDTVVLLRNHTTGVAVPVAQHIRTLLLERNKLIRAFGCLLMLACLPFALLPIIPAMIVGAVLTRVRVRRFGRRVAERFLPTLDELARAIPTQ